MASIRKREWQSPSGETKTAWQLDYRDQFGKRHHRQFERKKDAEAEKRRIEEEVRKGTHTGARDTRTLGKACQAYIDHLTERHRLYGKPSGYALKSYSGAARRHITTGPIAGLKLNTPRIWIPLQQLLDDTAKADRASPHGAVKHDKLALIKIVINQTIKFAVEQGWLHANPLRDHWLKLPERTKRQIEIPTKEEVHTLAEALQHRPKWMREITYRNAVVIINLAMYTPMREGEICGLWWEDIDWDRNEISTTKNYSAIDGLKDTKTAAGARKTPMLPQLRELLLKHAESRRCELTGYVLVGEDGEPVSPQSVASVHWPGIAKAAGLLRLSRRESDGSLYQGKTPKYHFHALRHFGAALLIEQSIQPYHLMRIMGHNDIKVTFNTYGHLFETDTEIRDKMIAGLSGFQLPQLPDRTTPVSLTSRDEDGRARVAALRAAGKKTKEIMAELGVSKQQVHRWDTPGSGAARLAERDRQILEHRREGKSLAAIAAIMRMTQAGVHGRLLVHGDPQKAVIEERNAKILAMRSEGKTLAEIGADPDIDMTAAGVLVVLRAEGRKHARAAAESNKDATRTILDNKNVAESGGFPG